MKYNVSFSKQLILYTAMVLLFNYLTSPVKGIII